MASNYDEVSKIVQEKIKPEIEDYGLNLSKFLISNITLPEEVEKMMDKRTSMGVLGDLGKFTQFQAAQALEDAAKNENGAAGVAMAIGAGFGMANQMGQTYGQVNNANQGSGNTVAPPPLPGTAKYFIAVNGQQQGPYDAAYLTQLATSNQLTRETLVWKDGMAAWAAAGTVADLQSVFPQMPPPLPGA